MARHPSSPFTDDQVAWLDRRYIPVARAHDCCPKCSGLRCLALPRCTETDSPLRELVQLEEAA